jgi:hypothetical protein
VRFFSSSTRSIFSTKGLTSKPRRGRIHFYQRIISSSFANAFGDVHFILKIHLLPRRHPSFIYSQYMKKFRKLLRLLVLVLLIALALMGVSLTGVFPISPNYRERYLDNEIKIERVDKKEEDETDLGENE